MTLALRPICDCDSTWRASAVYVSAYTVTKMAEIDVKEFVYKFLMRHSRVRPAYSVSALGNYIL